MDRLPLTLSIPEGKLLKEIKVTGYFHEMDYIISIPAIKMHMHTGMSLSFKNCKGLIYKREKIKLHHLTAPEITSKLGSNVKELDVAIADLSYVIKPDLAIIDGSYVLEGMGPSDGTTVEKDLIIASTNFLAADIVAMNLVQPTWTMDNIPHLKFIANYQKGPKSIKEIQTIPADITPLQGAIQAPPTNITIKYNNVHLLDIGSCSACLSTVFLFLRNNRQFIDPHYTPSDPLNLAIGKGIVSVDLYEDTFLIGNCNSSRKDDGNFINGCAPVQSTIFRMIKEHLRQMGKLKEQYDVDYSEN